MRTIADLASLALPGLQVWSSIFPFRVRARVPKAPRILPTHRKVLARLPQESHGCTLAAEKKQSSPHRETNRNIPWYDLKPSYRELTMTMQLTRRKGSWSTWIFSAQWTVFVELAHWTQRGNRKFRKRVARWTRQSLNRRLSVETTLGWLPSAHGQRPVGLRWPHPSLSGKVGAFVPNRRQPATPPQKLHPWGLASPTSSGR